MKRKTQSCIRITVRLDQHSLLTFYKVSPYIFQQNNCPAGLKALVENDGNKCTGQTEL